ncbi:MAG: zinc-ribbon domain containing protein [Clostridium sp.]|nr:zinc-ribbon domain containing protein [Clostridium sp.]
MIERKCVQCGRSFTIEDSEIEFYKSKSLSLPKRCKECRDKNKENSKKSRDNKVNIHKNEYEEKNTVKPISEERNANKSSSNKNNGSINGNGGNNNKKKNNIFKLFILAAVIIFGLFEGYGSYEKHNSPNPNTPVIENSSETGKKDNSSSQSTATDKDAYTFRTAQDCTDHFKKHGEEFGYTTEKQYVEGANKVINSSASLHKLEKEDGDDVYYLKDTNEFVIVSTSGFIRTYFKPQDGINYFNRQ